jgi:hypothetical protein
MDDNAAASSSSADGGENTARPGVGHRGHTSVHSSMKESDVDSSMALKNEWCGWFIGKAGSRVNAMKQEYNVDIQVRR